MKTYWRVRGRGMTFACMLLSNGAMWADSETTFSSDIRPLLGTHCFDCHDDTENPKGGVNLERFRSDADVMRDREVWASVYEKVESHQMPPPKRNTQPTASERTRLLTWIADVAARPDPALGARDPGKPMLRHLTRLEYNNTIRDLFGLDTDVFLVSERLPLSDKSYFKPANATMGDHVEVPLREYGAKYPVLLPQSGLPSDNRAEHGFRNRGDAMNFSPLLIEQFVQIAGEIVQHPELPRRSAAFAELLGIDQSKLPPPQGRPAPTGFTQATSVPAVAEFGGKGIHRSAGGSVWTPEEFRELVATAFREGRGGVFDVPNAMKNSTIAVKGGLIKAQFGSALLTINPNEDLWLVPFATAEETSGDTLIANKTKGTKVYELTFDVRDGDPDEGVRQLGVWVLGRSGQTGSVTLTARFTDDTERALTMELAEGSQGTTFAGFAAHSGETIKLLRVDGSNFSGDYVLLDDLGFVTNGRVRDNRSNPAVKENSVPPSVAAKDEPLRPETRVTFAPSRERFTKFLERAFRRPVTEEEVNRYFTLFEAEKAKGKSEADAMRQAAQAVLSAPSFLFLAEPGTGSPSGAPVRELSAFELATRLSYFLWASMPDDELFAAARMGMLRDPVALEAQVRRMLRDFKARELSESFAVQWLRLDQLYTAQPDRDLFKSYYTGAQGKDTLHGSQLVEALLLFETVLVEDRSILDFVDANYTWLNPRLAKFYELNTQALATAAADVLSDQPKRELKKDDRNANNIWRRVALPDPSRGGFLTMGAPLVVTSLPFRTSPVKRGAWLLETIFNRPPQEPKVAFVVENDTKEAAQTMSIRQRFEAHRNKAACYSCHIRLDPPGFALEHFDAVGRWRDTDGGQPVDARGVWNGQPFDGPAQYKKQVVENPDEFTRGFIEHLLSYALGRKLEIHDMPSVTEIQRAVTADGYRLSRVIVGIATSYPFRNTR